MVSIPADLPADKGSAYWLNYFEADRSVAVPILGPDGLIAGVVAVAMPEGVFPTARSKS